MATNQQVIDKLEELEDKFALFLQQYDKDMRGDMDATNGKGGVVNAIRDIKRIQDQYPSITYLFAKQPFKVAAVVLGVYIILMTLWTAGVIRILASVMGVDIGT